VSVSLNGAADDGEAGEGDNTGGDVERFLGGRGDDSFTGDGDAEELIGGSGNDRLAPSGGADYVAAGDGDDTIGAQDGELDRIACGLGTDTVTADFADQLAACETATVAPAPIPPDTKPPPIKFTSLSTRPTFKTVLRGLRFRLGSNEPASFVAALQGSAKRATVARVYNLTLATRSLKLGTGARLVQLKPRRALMGKRRRLTLRLRVTAKDAAGNVKVATRTIRVRR
jgi:Ca2+-binding RTX toxin-like protein